MWQWNPQQGIKRWLFVVASGFPQGLAGGLVQEVDLNRLQIELLSCSYTDFGMRHAALGRVHLDEMSNSTHDAGASEIPQFC